MVTGVRYCGGPSVGLVDWTTAKKSPGKFAAMWPQLRDRTVIGTFRGRTAIALACQLLGIGPGDEVLVPAYNCGTEIDAILHSGASVAGYPIAQDCQLAVADLISRKTSRTKAVYIIHYFGWEQPMRELRTWCDREGLLLIEDCALALFSGGQTGMIGQLSDAAIYSLPKTLGLGHGGLLSLPASRAIELPRLVVPGFSLFAKEIRQSVRATGFKLLDGAGLYGLLLSLRNRKRSSRALATSEKTMAGMHHAPSDSDASRSPLRERRDDFAPSRNPCAPAQGHKTGDSSGLVAMPDDYNFDSAIDLNRALHPRAVTLAGSLEWQKIVDRRRANYARLAAALAEIKGVALLHPRLPNGVCPLSLPLLVTHRDSAVASLQAKGIAALPWWAGFHLKSLNWSQFPDACWLKSHLLTLPVQQGLNVEDMEYVAKSVREVMG